MIGAVLGTAGFSWPSSKSRILPGAIVEHLTSFGADFSHGGQTKISELVHYGAAGTSGTVMEPLAAHQKFPNPIATPDETAADAAGARLQPADQPFPRPQLP